MKTRFLFTCFTLLLQFSLFSQVTKEAWSTPEKITAYDEKNWVQTSSYSLVNIQYNTFFKHIAQSRHSEQEISIPDPDGNFHTFSIKPMEVFEHNLQQKFPGYESFFGYDIHNPSVKIGISFTPFGLTASVLSSGNKTYYIDPIRQHEPDRYMVYYKKDQIPVQQKTFFCKKPDTDIFKDPDDVNIKKGDQSGSRTGDCQLRTYRLALACTGEYGIFHGGTIETVLAAFQTAVTRLNTVYRKEIGITFKLVDNVDKLIFFNPSTDPYSNANTNAMLSQNQTTVDNLIGRANYDIGHVFGTGDGGIASLGSVCSNSRKAQGVTGRPSPVGDAFFIDYVAHEMGHQFRANHTQNNSCQRNSSTAVEPGSGSTIMGYAGICSPNVQNNSHDYFHSISLSEISGFILSQPGCGTTENLMNSRPVLTLDKTNYTIPISTPFYLEATATDADADQLTYSWEQMNTETASMPPKSNNTGGPMFRSVPPASEAIRYFPDLKSKYGQWEVLPSVNRTMSFRAMVRDNSENGGCTQEQNVTVKTDVVAGPFIVTEPNVPTVVWNAGDQAPVTWDVANTTASPILCQLVDIRLSIDGGTTYPILLAESVPNTGIADVIVPNTPTTTARVMVVAADNIFFDISNFSFRINSSFDIQFEHTSTEICNHSAVFPFEVISLDSGANHAVTIDIVENDFGLTISVPDTIKMLPVQDMIHIDVSGMEPGIYTFTLKINDGPYSVLQKLEIVIRDPSLPLLLISPVSGHHVGNTTSNLALSWSTDPSSKYELQISTDPAFPDFVSTGITIEDNQYLWSGSPGTYFWKVRGLSECENTPWSETNVFYKGTKDPYDVPFLRNNLFVIPSSGHKNIYPKHLSVDYEESDPFAFTVIKTVSSGLLLLDSGAGLDTLQEGSQFYAEDIAKQKLSYLHNGSVETDDVFTFFIENTSHWQGIYDFNINILQSTHQTASVEIDRDIACYGDSGLVRFYLENLVTPVQYKLSTESQFQPLTTDSLWLAGGIYTFDILDGNNDTIRTNTLVMTSPEPLLNQSVQSYYNLIVESSGGAGISREYALNSLPFAGESVFYDIPAGDYTTYARDVNGCIASDSVTMMIEPLTISHVEWKDTLLCANDSTHIRLEVSGGFSPYQIEVDTTFYDGVEFIAGPGDYSVKLIDAGGKAVDTFLSAYSPDPLQLDIQKVRNEVSWSADGGIPPYLYSFDNVQYFTDVFASDLANGTYTIFVRDSHQCISSASFEINLLQSVKTDISHPECYGGTGMVTVIPENGTDPIRIGLNKDVLSPDLVIDSLRAGEYVLYVTDGLGDSIEQSFTVIEPDSLKIRFEIHSDTVTIIAEGGTSPYMYSVDEGLNYFPFNTFYEVPEGKHKVLVKDANGCIQESEFEILSSTGDLENEKQVRLYPNPADKTLTLEWKNQFTERLSLKMFDAQGREIPFKTIKQNHHVISVDVEMLPAGMYILTWIQDKKTEVIKFIKS